VSTHLYVEFVQCGKLLSARSIQNFYLYDMTGQGNAGSELKMADQVLDGKTHNVGFVVDCNMSPVRF
jgi:hypothetical protein